MFHNEWMNPSIHNITVQKRHMIAEMNAMKKDQSYLTKSHFIKSLFKKTMYHTPLEVRTNRIQQLSKRDIQHFHTSWMFPQNIQLKQEIARLRSLLQVIDEPPMGPTLQFPIFLWSLSSYRECNVSTRFYPLAHAYNNDTPRRFRSYAMPISYGPYKRHPLLCNTS